MLPMLAIGAGLTAGSAISNMFAGKSRAKARKQALGAENQRQEGLDTEIGAINTGAQDRYAGFGAGADANVGRISDYFKSLNDRSVPQQIMPASTSAPTNVALAQEMAGAHADSDQQADALGGVMGFGDYLGGLNRSTARDASQVGQLGGFKTGSARITPLELEAANQKGAKAALLADLLGLGGRVALGSAVGGGTLTGTPAAAVSSPWDTRIQ